MLTVKNLSLYHKKDMRVLMENVSFSVNRGEKVAIIGEEGNGKSTLLKALYDPAMISDYILYKGEVDRCGVLGYCPQTLPQALGELTPLRYLVAEDYSNYGEAVEALVRLHLDSAVLERDLVLKDLSGGERVKVQLAKLLMKDYDGLLLDEPTNDLDITTLETLEAFIADYSGAILYISHDEVLIERTATKIIHLEQIMRKTVGKVSVDNNGYEDYMAKRSRRIENSARMAASEEREYREAMDRYRRIEGKVDHDQRVISRQDPHGAAMLKKKMHAVKSMGRRLERRYEDRTRRIDYEKPTDMAFLEIEPIPSGKRVLDVKWDRLEVEGRILARDIELQLMGGEKAVILGENGCGKSTLIKRIVGENCGRRDLRVAYMPQKYGEILPFDRTPVDYLVHEPSKDEISRVRTFLGSMRYTDKEMLHRIGELSEGQKGKLFILKMIYDRAQFLILDEPSRNFSPLTNPVLREALGSFPGTILAVSHDRKLIEEVFTTVYRLDGEGLHRQ